MDLKELTYIVTVADQGSISQAAEKLFMAQSSLSQALRTFEAELGTSIFVRTTRGVRPTAAGEAFIEQARQILNRYRLAQSEVWDIEGLQGGRVEFGISTYRGMYLLPPVLTRFKALYPGVHVQITELDSIDLEDRILKGLLDLALIAMPPVRLKDQVEFLLRDEIMVVTASSHPIMKFARPLPEGDGLWVDFLDTTGFEYILGPPNTILGRAARQEFQRCGQEPIGLNTDVSAPFAAAMAMEGLGLALTYRSCMVDRDNVRYLRIGAQGVFLDLGLAYPTGGYRSKAARALRELFHERYLTGDRGI